MINQVLTLILNFNFNQLRGYILILCYLKILIIRWSIFHSLNTNLREVNNDILKDWLDFREEDLCSLTCDEDRKHHIYFDEISERILKRVPKKDRKYVEKQLSFLDENFMNYIDYWNEKYYRNGFGDGIQLIGGYLNI